MIENGPNTEMVLMAWTLSVAVLLVACANLASLLVSRAPVRAREIALRLAIGAASVAGRPDNRVAARLSVSRLPACGQRRLVVS